MIERGVDAWSKVAERAPMKGVTYRDVGRMHRLLGVEDASRRGRFRRRG
jgi:hypothetical protein